jgi:hypothetical protein
MKYSTVLVTTLVLSAPILSAGTLTGQTGIFDIPLAGHLIQFAPIGSNLSINGDFAGVPGVPSPAEITVLDFASVPPPVQFQHGAYILALQLEPLTHSTGQVTTTAGGTFTSFFDVFFAISFNFTGSGSGDGSGDVLGEFGGLPGIGGCVNGAVSTCELRERVAVAGNFDALGSTLSNVSVTASIPEPATIPLVGSVLLLLALRRRR